MKKDISIDEKFIVNIFDKYLSAKVIIQKTNLQSTKYNLSEKGTSYGGYDIINFQKHIQIVDTVLALMPKTEYTLIIKTFLMKSNKNWWKKFYQKNEYEKLYKKSINRFLYLYLI